MNYKNKIKSLQAPPVIFILKISSNYVKIVLNISAFYMCFEFQWRNKNKDVMI